MVEFPAGVDAADCLQLSGDMISELDRCFRYGDGLFETILFVDQEPVLFDEHLSRLRRGVQALALDYIVMPDDLLVRCRAAAQATLVTQAPDRYVVRIQLSRGEGGRGYMPPDPPLSVREVLSCHAPPSIPATIELRLLHTRIMVSRLLSGIKHCSRLEQVLAAAELQECNRHENRDCWEGLLHDELGFLAEGTRTNVIIESRGHLLTPLLDRSGLHSTLLSWLCSPASLCANEILPRRMRLHQVSGLQVVNPDQDKGDISADALPVAVWETCPLDGIALCNSVVGVRPVNSLMGIALPVGPGIRRLMNLVNPWFGDV